MNLHDIISMGGYGAYVWSAYSMTFFVFSVLAFLTLKDKKKMKKTLQRHLGN
jgi:heme exporter protein CcmD